MGFAPDILTSLSGPVNTTDLDRLKHLINMELPGDFLSLYQWHNGIDPSKISNFFFGFQFSPLRKAIEVLESNSLFFEFGKYRYVAPEIDASKREVEKRIVIGDDSDRCFIVVDLVPSKAGTVGQVIFLDIENQVAFLVSSSVTELLAKFAQDLEAGLYGLHGDALEDGVCFLDPARSIDIGNWYNYEKWSGLV
jgi:cell wall assembly regulator SMI1